MKINRDLVRSVGVVLLFVSVMLGIFAIGWFAVSSLPPVPEKETFIVEGTVEEINFAILRGSEVTEFDLGLNGTFLFLGIHSGYAEGRTYRFTYTETNSGASLPRGVLLLLAVEEI